MPASAPVPPAAANTNSVRRSVLTPIRRAACRLIEHARTARPRSVYFRNQNVASNSAGVAPQTQRLCTGKIASNSVKTPSPLNPGRLSGSLPKRDQRNTAQDDGNAERDRHANEMRRVAHRRQREPFLQRRRSPRMPSWQSGWRATAGRPRRPARRSACRPSMTYSPWAKLTTPVTFAVSTKPSATNA